MANVSRDVSYSLTAKQVVALRLRTRLLLHRITVTTCAPPSSYWMSKNTLLQKPNERNTVNLSCGRLFSSVLCLALTPNRWCYHHANVYKVMLAPTCASGKITRDWYHHHRQSLEHCVKSPSCRPRVLQSNEQYEGNNKGEANSVLARPRLINFNEGTLAVCQPLSSQHSVNKNKNNNTIIFF